LLLGGSFVSLVWFRLLASFFWPYERGLYLLVPFGVFSLLMWAAVLRFMKLLSVSTSRGTISISDGRLRLDLATVFRRRQYEWDAREIIGVVSGRLLEIETANSIYHVTTVRSAEENDWLAHVLRRELDVESEAPHGCEIAVKYRHPSWGEICDGYLETQPSCMILGNGLEQRQTWVFHAVVEDELVGLLDRFRRRAHFRLSPSDTTCRVAEDGRTCLRIRPSGKSFDLSIWCADPEALPRALERFWGAAG
jgi:hypothetical protein